MLRKKFLADRRGAVAIITAIVMLPVLLYCVGVPIDLARAVQLRSALQNISDTAALAGSAELAQGGTALQACNIANQFVAAEAGQLSVPYSTLTPNGSFATTNGETDTETTVSTGNTTTQSSAGSTASTNCQSTQPTVSTSTTTKTSGNTTTTTTTASITSPYQVVVGISTKIPTSFMAFAKSNIPVAVSGTASGPTGFVKICMENGYSISDDSAAFYYYYVDPSGNFDTDQAGDALSKTSPLPALASNLLTDNTIGVPYQYISTGCSTNATARGIQSYLVLVHLAPGWHLAYYYQNITGHKNDCYYAGTFTTAGAAIYNETPGNTRTVKPGDAYQWPTFGYYGCFGNSSTIYSSTGFATAATTWNGVTPSTPPTSGGPNTNALTTFQTTAYGGTIETTNRFYTTDYPASLNTKTNSVALGPNGAVGDFSASGQSTAIDKVLSTNPQQNYVYFNSNANLNQNQLPTQTSGDNVIGQTSGDLVCLVNASTHTQDVNVSTTYISSGGYTLATNANNDQQQNVILQNSSQSTLYKCPTNVSGDPYNLNPSCADLNGATITGGWNDMGGYPADSVGYQDLVFSISCTAGTGVPQLDYDNIALTN